jgi:hypothetical protein
MSDLSVSGPQLKKLIKKTKKKSLGFGFNPGSKPEGSVFTMDLKKQPKVLGKAAKDDGESNKVAYGTAALDGKVLKLMVERMLPALAKNVKKFLKFNKVMLNVEIYDENGNLLESDVEDNLPDDPEMDSSDEDDDDDLDAGSDDDNADDGDDAGSDDETEEGEAVSDKKDENADTAVSAADVAKQLGALKPRIQAQPAEIAGKLTPPFQQAVAALKGGEIEEATSTASKIESALDKLEGRAKAKPQEAAIPQAPPMADPQMLKLMQMVEAMRARGNLITDPARLDAYNKALDRAASLIQSQETEQAVTLLKKLQEMLKQLAAAKTAAMQEEDNAANYSDQADKEKFVRGIDNWAKAIVIARNEVETLKQKVITTCGDMPGAPRLEGAFKSLTTAFDKLEKAIAVPLAEANDADDAKIQDQAKRKVIITVDQVEKFLASSTTFRGLDDNPFVKVQASKALTTALALIRGDLAA